MTPRPQFGSEYIPVELQELGGTVHAEVAVFLIGGGAKAFRGLTDTTKDIDLVVTTEAKFDRLRAALDDQGFEEEMGYVQTRSGRSKSTTSSRVSATRSRSSVYPDRLKRT